MIKIVITINDWYSLFTSYQGQAEYARIILGIIEVAKESGMIPGKGDFQK